MKTISYTVAHTHLAKIMSQVCNNRKPVIITGTQGNSVVLISLQDYQAMEETAYLLRLSANARQLLESIAEFEAGKGIKQQLIE